MQEGSVASNSLHYNWSPGDSVCPLHMTNALALAFESVTHAVGEVSVDMDRARITFSPEAKGKGWHYTIRMPVEQSKESTSRSRNGWFTVLVPLDGNSPDIRQVPLEELREKYDWLDRLQKESSGEPSKLTPEERQIMERERVRENLRQYQMEVIRSGMTPLPIPLTQEMDDQLTKEGILPPATNQPPRKMGNGFRRAPAEEPSRKLSPAEQDRKRAALQETLRKHQDQLMLQGMPPLAGVQLTPDQKMKLEEQGIVFFEDGSWSNKTTGIHYPVPSTPLWAD